MKKLFYTSLLAFCIANVNAQPIVQTSNFAPVGTTVGIAAGSGVGFNPGASGADQTWDFSSLTVIPAGNLTVVDPSTTPSGSTYPTATHAYKIDVTLPSPATEYNYYLVTATDMDMIASGIGSTDPEDYTPDNRKELESPMSLNDTYTDSYQTTDMINPETLTRTYDGYGTLITPSGTYNNVARMSFSFDGGPMHYQWLLTNPLMMLIDFNADNNSLIVVDATSLSIEHNPIAANNHDIFPNPSHQGIVSISNALNVKTIYVNDVTGRCVKEMEVATNGKVDLNGIKAGVYFITIKEVNGNTGIQKLVIQ